MMVKVGPTLIFKPRNFPASTRNWTTVIFKKADCKSHIVWFQEKLFQMTCYYWKLWSFWRGWVLTDFRFQKKHSRSYVNHTLHIGFYYEKFLFEKKKCCCLSQAVSTADKLMLGLFKFSLLHKQSLRVALEKRYSLNLAKTLKKYMWRISQYIYQWS